jgi:hypothetical protein
MTREKKILLMMPSFVNPKKKTKVPPIRKCLTSSALPLYFLAFIPDTIGSPLQEGHELSVLTGSPEFRTYRDRQA